MSVEPNDLDRLGEQQVAESTATTPTMMWLVERSAKLRQRRRFLIAAAVTPVILLIGVAGWLTVGSENIGQSIESVDQPDNPSSAADPNSNGNGDSSAAPDALVIVPNVVGITVDKAFDILDEVGLEVDWDVVSELEGQTPSGDLVVKTSPEPGVEVQPGSTVVLFVFEPEQRNFYDYLDPDLQTEPLYPLVLDPAELGAGWDEFFLGFLSEVVLFDPAQEGGLPACSAVDPLIVRDGFLAEYGFEASPDDALFVVSTGSPEELVAFYNNFRDLNACSSGGPLEQVVTLLPDPELPGVIEATRTTTNDNLNQRSEVLLIHHEDFVYLMAIGIKDGAEPFDIVSLATELLAAYEASR